MNQSFQDAQDQIVTLCKRYGVRELYAFGSVLDSRYTETSDIDLLVELDWEESSSYSERYFAFKSALEELLGRPVDLVCYSAIRNPYFLEEIERTKSRIYAA